MESKSTKSDTSIRVEKYPLPANVEGVLSLVREVMMGGSVQRIELDVSLPVRVIRTVEEGDPGMREVDIGLGGQLRQVDFVEYCSSGALSFQTVVDMMQLMHDAKRHPTCWVTGPGGEDHLNLWLEWHERGMPVGTGRLLGLPVRQVQDLPSDVLILCGSEYPSAEDNEITLAVKAAMEMRSDDEQRHQSVSEVDDRVRPDPGERPAAASQLALAAGGLRRVAWEQTGQSGEGVD